MRCDGAGLANSHGAKPHSASAAAAAALLIFALLSAWSEWGATQQLSRVPAAQVTVTNPGDRGLIPSQPYWPPDVATQIRKSSSDPPAPVSRHSRAHLSAVESGVRIQGHGYRKAPAGASQPLPTVVLDALIQLDARSHPPRELSLDKPESVGRNFSQGYAKQPPVTSDGHQAPTGSSNAELNQSLGLQRTPATAVRDVVLLIDTTSSEKGPSLQPWREEITPDATVQSQFANHVHSQTPEVLQGRDHRNKEGNDTLDQQSFEATSDGVAKEPTATLSTVGPDPGIIPYAEHNNPPGEQSENSPLTGQMATPSNLSVLGEAHHDNWVPATSSSECPQRSNVSPVDGWYLPVQHHHGTLRHGVTTGSRSQAASKLRVVNPWRPTAPLPLTFRRKPDAVFQKAVTERHREQSRPAIPHQETPRLVHPLHSPGRPKFKNVSSNLPQQTKDLPHVLSPEENKQISKDGLTRYDHYQDYYYYDYDDYYYDYDYYVDGPESGGTTPKPAPTAPPPYRRTPYVHSLAGTTPYPPPLRPGHRHPVAPSPFFIPPRTASTHAPRAWDPRPYGLPRHGYFPSLPALRRSPWHDAPSYVPTTHLGQEPPYTERANTSREPLLKHPETSEDSPSTRNGSSQRVTAQDEVTQPSDPAPPASLNATTSPGTTAPRKGTSVLHEAPMPDANATRGETASADKSSGGGGAFYHSSTRHRPLPTVELGTFLGKGRHLTVRVSPEHLLRLAKRRQETRREERHHAPVYFTPREQRQQQPRPPRRAAPGLYKWRTRRRRRPKNSKGENSQRGHRQSQLLPSTTPRGRSQLLDYSLKPQQETFMVRDTPPRLRPTAKLTQTFQSPRMPTSQDSSSTSLRRNVTRNYQETSSNPTSKDVFPVKANSTLHSRAEPDATSSEPPAAEETSGSWPKENEDSAGHNTPVTRRAPSSSSLPSLAGQGSPPERKPFSRLPLLGLTGEQALKTAYGM